MDKKPFNNKSNKYIISFNEFYSRYYKDYANNYF